jgi:hypothetical protein
MLGCRAKCLLVFVKLSLVLAQRLNAFRTLKFVKPALGQRHANSLNAVLNAKVRHNSNVG